MPINEKSRPIKAKVPTNTTKISAAGKRPTASKPASAAKSGAKAKTTAKTPAKAIKAKVRAGVSPRVKSNAGEELRRIVIDALDDMKALEVKILDVRGLTDVADTMVIASGTSDRHVRSVAKNVVEKTKAAGFRPHGVEGQQDSDWVLIDLHEMIVHVMLPRTREFYGLEKLWDMTATQRAVRA